MASINSKLKPNWECIGFIIGNLDFWDQVARDCCIRHFVMIAWDILRARLLDVNLELTVLLFQIYWCNNPQCDLIPETKTARSILPAEVYDWRIYNSKFTLLILNHQMWTISGKKFNLIEDWKQNYVNLLIAFLSVR